MAQSAAQLAAKMNRYATTIPRVNKRAVESSALLMKDTALAELDKVAPRRKVNVGRSGSRLGVRYDVKGIGNPTALVRATGPWQIVENDTRAHVIAAARLGTKNAIRARTGEIALSGGGVRFGRLLPTTRTTRSGAVQQRAGKRALTINGSVRAYAFHRGTKGRHPWRKAVDKATPKLVEQFRRGHRAALVETFAGN